MTLNAHYGLPEGGKARRVYLLLRDEISNGVFKEGARLPAEHRLAESFDVSRITIRRALEALAADGWIVKKAGAGSVVRAPDPAGHRLSADFATLIPHLVEMDRKTTARLLSFSYEAASSLVARALGLAEGADVQKAVRVRASGGRPFSHLTTHVPKQIALSYDEADLATQPLFRLLERSGVSVQSAHQSVTAALATPEVAEALEVSVGSPLLFVQRVVRDAQGQGVEHLSALYRPDLFRLEMTLARVGAGEARHWEPVIGGRCAVTGLRLLDKLWADHEVLRREDGTSLLWVDRHLVHEGSHHAFAKIAGRGLPVAEPGLTFGVTDHYAPTRAAPAHDAVARMIHGLERNTARHGIALFGLKDPRQGIVHVIGPEQGLTLPGLLVTCGDSHTSTHGAFGALAFGIGATEVAHVLATQTVWQRKPKAMRITVTGRLGPGVGAKDMALAWIARLGADGARGHAVEYAGPAVRALSMEGRMTLCNLSIEGARVSA